MKMKSPRFQMRFRNDRSTYGANEIPRTAPRPEKGDDKMTDTVFGTSVIVGLAIAAAIFGPLDWIVLLGAAFFFFVIGIYRCWED